MKISGDGAKFSKSTNIILTSFAILETQQNILSARGNLQICVYKPIQTILIYHLIYIMFLTGNHTFAAIQGPECYDALSTGLQPCFDTIRSLLDNPSMTVNGLPCTLEFFLGGDYKVIL